MVGFDDMLPVAEQTDPPLTTVRQDIEGMGRLMARLLLRGLEDGPAGGARRDDGDDPGAPETGPSALVLPTTLVHRATA